MCLLSVRRNLGGNLIAVLPTLGRKKMCATASKNNGRVLSATGKRVTLVSLVALRLDARNCSIGQLVPLDRCSHSNPCARILPRNRSNTLFIIICDQSKIKNSDSVGIFYFFK